MATVVAVVLVAVAGCGDQRSASAFCDELAAGMDELRASVDDASAQEDPLVGLLSMVGSIGDIQRLLERLAEVAPEEIQQDVEVVRDVMARQTEDVGDAVSDPAGALASSLGDALINQGSFERVDAFAREECGQPVFGP